MITLDRNIIVDSKEYIQIKIRDTGCGIKKGNLDKIFDPFYSTKNEGHGLGLATVYSILKQHDGWIEVKSEIDAGTTFSIYLPAEEGTLQSESPGTIVEHGAGTILLMDDQKYILDIAKNILENVGFDVLLAGSGNEAVELVKKSQHTGNSILACFLDLTLPGELGGIDVVNKIKEIFPKLVAIASSGYSDSHVMGHPSQYGFDDSIEKPYTRKDFLQILKRNNLI